MRMGIRLVAEYYDIKSGKVIESRVLREQAVASFPKR